MAGEVLAVMTRLRVVGPLGEQDLVVPPRAPLRDVVAAYAGRFDAHDRGLVPVALTGRTWDLDARVVDCGLRDGSLLALTTEGPVPVARDGAAPDPVDAEDAEPPGDPRDGGLPAAAVLLGLVAAAGCALGAAAVLALYGSGQARVAGAVVLTAVALLAAVTARPGRDGVGRAAAGPVFGAAAGFAAGHVDGPGGLLLGLGVGAFGAALAAGIGRLVSEPDDDDVLTVVLVLSVALASLPAVVVAVGAGTTPLWVLLFVSGVVAPKLLPSTAVDVPDTALLDVDRLAVTAWSARQTAPAGRSRHLVSARGVRRVARRGTRVLEAGTVGVCVLAALSACLLAAADGEGLAGITAWVSLGLGAVSLALAARAFRSRVSRSAMRVAASVSALAWGAVLAQQSQGLDSLVVAGGAVVVAALVVVAAVALGRGWRSVWWGRLGDVAETAATVLLVALVPLSTGLYLAIGEFVR